MHRTTTRGSSPAIAWLATALCLGVAPAAHAGAHASIEVTGLKVSVTPVTPGQAPSVSFAGAGGSRSTCEATSGRPPADQVVTANGTSAFGVVAGDLSSDLNVGGTASLAGDVFGAGATVRTSAWATSLGPEATGQGTLGLVNDVSAAAFTLAPGTRMTITAQVQAFASVDGVNPADMADAGLLMMLTDTDGAGLQFARVSFDALALGLFGAYDDDETTFVSLVYENDTDADIRGLFSGYVASYAYTGDPSPAPEAGSLATMLAGLALVVAAGARRRNAVRQ